MHSIRTQNFWEIQELWMLLTHLSERKEDYKQNRRKDGGGKDKKEDGNRRHVSAHVYLVKMIESLQTRRQSETCQRREVAIFCVVVT
jgi:hypothetical protein